MKLVYLVGGGSMDQARVAVPDFRTEYSFARLAPFLLTRPKKEVELSDVPKDVYRTFAGPRFDEHGNEFIVAFHVHELRIR